MMERPVDEFGRPLMHNEFGQLTQHGQDVMRQWSEESDALFARSSGGSGERARPSRAGDDALGALLSPFVLLAILKFFSAGLPEWGYWSGVLIGGLCCARFSFNWIAGRDKLPMGYTIGAVALFLVSSAGIHWAISRTWSEIFVYAMASVGLVIALGIGVTIYEKFKSA